MAARFSSSNPSESQNDIIILLLGETGVGKSTFINAFANYLAYDTLEMALRGEMLALIPSNFCVTDTVTFESESINVGTRNENEFCDDIGASQTQGCKCYTFSIGKRYLRLIDTPGIGDCRGVAQDETNFDRIFTFVSRYGHLNGVCLLFKPNQERITIQFRYNIQGILRYLPVSVKNNILFVFTNAQATFFAPGSTAQLLKNLLAVIKNETNIEIPFVRDNTFFFDNESFRFLAVHNAGFHFLDNQEESFVRYWNQSVLELQRMVKKIVQCDAYSTKQLRSINEAYQLIRRLPRPIAEVVKFIQENIQLAKEHKEKILKDTNKRNLSQMPECTTEVISFRQPCLACTNDQCSKLSQNNQNGVLSIGVKCLEPCHINDTESEYLTYSAIKRCEIMNKQTGKCGHCGCDWSTHRIITYDIKKLLTYVDMDEKSRNRSPEKMLEYLQTRIERLNYEQDIIRYMCTRLTLFLQMNSINPTNDTVIEYIQYYIREEKQKTNQNQQGQAVLQGLENMVEEYRKEIALLKSDVGGDTTAKKDPPTADEIYACKVQICLLPISGRYMKSQLENLESNNKDRKDGRDEHIKLPRNARNSMVMQALENTLS